MFLTSVALVGYFTIIVKDVTLIEGKKDVLNVHFNRVSGLEKGHKVRASGMEIGQVADLELQSDGSVKVKLNLTKKIKLRDGYKILVKDASALGGKYVDIQLGQPVGSEIPLSRDLRGESQPSLLDNPDVRELLGSFKRIAAKIERGEGTIGALLTKREIYDNIRVASENLRKVTEQIRNAEGSIGKLLYDTKFAERIDNIVINIETMTDNIRNGKGLIGKLINDDKLYKDLEQAIHSTKTMMDNLVKVTEKINGGEGTIGKLISDDEAYKKLVSALKDARKVLKGLNKTVKQINNGRGTVSTLLKDEQMAMDLKNTVNSLKVVVGRLKQGKGTVGKLLTDDSLYKDLKRVIKNFSDSLEDTREQVPITTFTSILFKAF